MELPPGLTQWEEAVSEAKYNVRSNNAKKVLERGRADAEGRAGSGHSLSSSSVPPYLLTQHNSHPYHLPLSPRG